MSYVDLRRYIEEIRRRYPALGGVEWIDELGQHRRLAWAAVLPCQYYGDDPDVGGRDCRRLTRRQALQVLWHRGYNHLAPWLLEHLQLPQRPGGEWVRHLFRMRVWRGRWTWLATTYQHNRWIWTGYRWVRARPQGTSWVPIDPTALEVAWLQGDRDADVMVVLARMGMVDDE